jgi:hypothetical protein
MIEVLHVKDWLRFNEMEITIHNQNRYWRQTIIGLEGVDAFDAAYKVQVMARTNRFVFTMPEITIV